MALDAGGNIQTFVVDRNRYEMAASQSEDIPCQAVTRFFYPHTIPRIEQNASGNLERLLGAANDHDLFRFAT
jgi:hypothetical protein